MNSLDPRQSGGVEADLKAVPYATSHATAATVEDLDAILEDAEMDGSSSGDDDDDAQLKNGKGKGRAAEPVKEELKPGMARIIRDENGKVVKIVLAGEDGAEVEEQVIEPSRAAGGDDDDDEDDDEDNSDEEEAEPWGPAMKDWDAGPAQEKEFGSLEGVTKNSKQGIPIFGAPRRVEAKTDVVRALEERAARKTKVIRHTSEFEEVWLVKLVQKYGDDTAKMARDLKLNRWQKTPNELRKMCVDRARSRVSIGPHRLTCCAFLNRIAKAGGVDTLKQAPTA